MALSPWQRVAKRALDIAGASVALVAGAPIMAVTAVAVAREVFKQK